MRNISDRVDITPFCIRCNKKLPPEEMLLLETGQLDLELCIECRLTIIGENQRERELVKGGQGRTSKEITDSLSPWPLLAMCAAAGMLGGFIVWLLS